MRRFSAEALARRSARHPWMTMGVWLLLLLAAVYAMATMLGDVLTTEEGLLNNPDSHRANEMLEQNLRGPEQVREVVIIRSDDLTVDDAAFRRQVETVYEQLLALGPGIIDSAAHFYLTGDTAMVSADRHATIIPLTMTGSQDDANASIPAVMETVSKADGREGFEVMIAGGASIAHDFMSIAEADMQKSEAIGGLVALFILIVVFGTLVAAVLPLGLAVFAIVIAVGITAVVGHWADFAFHVVNMISMMGLAVGIDYSLFVVSRYREERDAGVGKLAAIEHAAATAGRAVAFSGAMVVMALLGMFMVPTTIFRSLATGAIFVVVVAILAALTLLPAMLAVLGDRIDRWRVPLIGRRNSAAVSGRGFWPRALTLVMRRPVVSLLATLALLLAAAAPYLDIHTGSAASPASLPQRAQTREGFIAMGRDFSAGLTTPLEIVISGDTGSPAAREAIARLEAKLAADPMFGRQQKSEGGGLVLIETPLGAEQTSEAAFDTVRNLRQELHQLFAGSGVEALVTGITAENLDYIEVTDRYRLPVIAFVLTFSFLLLMVVFHSLIVPLKAIIMNLLSVGAAYGLLVLVFQKGVGVELLGFQRAEAIEAWIPLFLFAILFGLSMDYHVFLLSRVRERYMQTGDNTEAVAFGIRSTAGIITGAALIMVAVFSGFAAGDLVMFQQIGFGLAVAVLIDATIVRTVLVPASMKLLGSWNWYLPGFLSWLPDFHVEGRNEGDQK